MDLFVDFNMREGDGRYPALLREGIAPSVGDEVVATDGEGTMCHAVVTELIKDRRIAMVRPIEGTWDRESDLSVQLP